MIEISEKFIIRAIRAGLDTLRDDTEMFERIFKPLNRSETKRLRRYLDKEDGITVTQGFPLNRSEAPVFAVMLDGENEAEKQLGNFAQSIGGEYGEMDGLTTKEITITEPVTVTVQGDTATFKTGKKNITSITYIEDSEGHPINLDGMYIEDGRLGEVAIFGGHGLKSGMQANVSYVYQQNAYASYGSIFDKAYRVEVWASNADLVVHLYHLLKWILLSSKHIFESDNQWLNVSIGGGDLEPLAEQRNENAFRRAISLTFQIEETFEMEEYFIQQVKVNYMKAGGNNG